jgi:hypothetical protein
MGDAVRVGRVRRLSRGAACPRRVIGGTGHSGIRRREGYLRRSHTSNDTTIEITRHVTIGK